MRKVFAICILALLTLVAQAQILTPVKWKIRLDDNGGSTDKMIIFTATADKGWHLYDMNLPSGGPVSTSITFETLQGAELLGKPFASIRPTVVHDPMFKMDLRWYAGSVTFTQRIKVTNAKKFKAAGQIEFMACNDATCLPPDQKDFSFDRHSVHLDPNAASTESISDSLAANVSSDTANIQNVNATTDSVIGLAQSGTSPQQIAKLTNRSDLWTPVVNELKGFGDAIVSAADMSLLYIFLAGFVGGLIALLTPCVWPMIPMTVSFFLKRTRERKKAIRDAVIYGLSIIVIYLIMGLLITGIFGASALNDLSTNAIFNIIFFLLLVLFAVSFFGAFEMVLPFILDQQDGSESRLDNRHPEHLLHGIHLGPRFLLLHRSDYRHIAGSSCDNRICSRSSHRNGRICLGSCTALLPVRDLPKHDAEHAEVGRLAQLRQGSAWIPRVGTFTEIPLRCRPRLWLGIARQRSVPRPLDRDFRTARNVSDRQTQIQKRQ
jgi:hypothetical protein